MSKQTYTVQQYSLRESFQKKLRKGLVITFLFTAFAVGATATETYNATFVDNPRQVIALAPTVVNDQDTPTPETFELLTSKSRVEQGDAKSLQGIRFDALRESYYKHKGNSAGGVMQKQYRELASSLSKLPYSDMLARYSMNNDVNMVVMTFPNDMELNITQASGVDEVAFSIYHGDVLLYMGSEQFGILVDKVLSIIN